MGRILLGHFFRSQTVREKGPIVSYGAFRRSKCAELRDEFDGDDEKAWPLFPIAVFDEILIEKVTFQGYVPLSLIPEQGGLSYIRERGMPPNGLKGPPGRDDGREPPAQRHRHVDVHVVVSAASPVVINRGDRLSRV